jgi:hypothetical protein
MPSPAGKGKQILVVTGMALYAGKTVMKYTTIKILVYFYYLISAKYIRRHEKVRNIIYGCPKV